MATLNLGRIKPVFRGAYAGGTAYVIDDIVTSGNETFICIQASTGNATSNASYWTKLAAKGADGTNGTDVGTTITTQGDLLYRDGSGLQRLAKGTAGQALKMNTAANAPEWGTISSDFVKLASQAVTSDVSSFNFQQFVDNSTYQKYYLSISDCRTSNANFTVRALTGTSTEYSSSNYRSVSFGNYGSNSHDYFRELTSDRFRFVPGWHFNTGNDGKGENLEMWFTATANKAFRHNTIVSTIFYNSNSDAVAFQAGGGINVTDQTWTGIKIYCDGGTIHKCNAELYGLKK